MSDSVRMDPTSTDYVRKGYSKVKKGVDRAADFTGDGSGVNNVAKVARRLFELLAAFAPLAEAMGPAGNFFKGFTELYKVVGIVKSGKEVLNGEGVREVAAGILGVGIAGLSAAKIAESFKWFEF